MSEESLSSGSVDMGLAYSTSGTTTIQPYSRQYEISKTSGSLRSITQSLVRQQKVNGVIDEKRFLPPSMMSQREINPNKKVVEIVAKLNKKASKRVQQMYQSSQEKINAYPCVFMKRKELPENKKAKLHR